MRFSVFIVVLTNIMSKKNWQNKFIFLVLGEQHIFLMPIQDVFCLYVVVATNFMCELNFEDRFICLPLDQQYIFLKPIQDVVSAKVIPFFH